MTRFVRASALAMILGLLGSTSWAQNPLDAVAAPEQALKTVQKVAVSEAHAAKTEALGSPHATMKTFLQAIDELWENPSAGWDDAASTMDLAPDDPVSGHESARMLYGVLSRVGRIDLDEIPDDDDVREDKLTSYRYFPNRHLHRHILRHLKSPPAGSITLRPNENGYWLFDRETIQSLPALFKQMKPLPVLTGRKILTVSDYIRGVLPRSLTDGTFLTLAYWQWIGIALLILAGLFVDLAIRLILRRIERQLKSEGAQSKLRDGLRPIGQVGALLVWWITLQFLEIEGVVGQVLSAVLAILLAIAGTISALRLTDLVGEHLIARAKATPSNIDDVLAPLVVRAIKIIVVVVAIVFTASALNLPLTPLLASITIAGVAFSFAAKDTVENFFGSIAVLLDRPFDMGDWVVIDDTEGMVEQVGFRSTRIRTFYNSLVTIPNANLVRAVVDNYGRRRFRRWKTTLGVQYDTTPEQLVSFTEGLRELVRLHPYTRKDYYEVYCNEFGGSSLDILLYIFFEVPDWNTELRERERMFLDIVRLADQLGVQFAFPTQTVHVFPGEPPSGAKSDLPGSNTETRASLEGVTAAQRLVSQQPWMETKPAAVQIAMQRTEIQLDDAGNPPASDEDREI